MTAQRPSDSRRRNGTWRVLRELSVPSEPGNERMAMETVAEAISDLDIRGGNLERLKTAVDEGSGPPAFHAETPDLEAKLEGMQSPRGWGLFLIKNMVDDMEVTGDEHHHTVELLLNLERQAEGG